MTNDHDIIELRLTRLEEAARQHNEGEKELRKRTRELDGRFEESMGRLNAWADHVEECLRMVDSNREQNDTVHEIILRHLGVDMSRAGSPPRMKAEQIAAALGVEWPRTPDPTTFDQDLCDAVMASPMLRDLTGPSVQKHVARIIARIAARLAAERQPVPVIPEGLHLMSITFRGPGNYKAFLGNEDGGVVAEGTGSTWIDSLADAIRNALENDHE